MQTRQVLTHARLVLPDEVVTGTVVLREGRITGLDLAPSTLPSAIDLEGDYLIARAGGAAHGQPRAPRHAAPEGALPDVGRGAGA